MEHTSSALAKSHSISLRAVDLLELNGADRSAKSYAFLYAMFRRTEVSKTPVRDALDCLTPMISAIIGKQANRQVDVQKMQRSLKEAFGFDIPLYAIEDLLPRLANSDIVTYDKRTKRYIANLQPSSFEDAKVEIEAQYDLIADALETYAVKLGFSALPPSGSWGDALLNFLRDSRAETQVQFQNIKGVIIDPKKVEVSIVGSFLRNLHSSSPALFKIVLNVYMGTLIEDFILAIAEVGIIRADKPVVVFFDTAVLMRLLGTSGRLLATATAELTRYLQDLGFEIKYFSGNESEVANIFNTLVFVKDAGKELEGETAEAVSTGEISITDIRMLQNTFAEGLAAKNVFPADQLESDFRKDKHFQIDEVEFAHYLNARAIERGKIYGKQNRENDAAYLGHIMRLRRGNRTKDLSQCGFIFVTANKFLSYASKRYLIEQRLMSPQHCPPMLSLGQAATIAWLLKDQTIVPEKAGRELLSNCIAAIRPDAEWFKFFKEGVEKNVGSLEQYASGGTNSITLQAARRIAQEESFGLSALVRELNMAEILRAAKDEEERLISGAEKNKLELHKALENQELERGKVAELEHHLSTIEARERALRDLRNRETEEGRRRSSVIASNIVLFFSWLAIVVFALLSVFVYVRQGSKNTIPLWIVTAVLAIISIFAFADLIGVDLAKKRVNYLREWLSSLIFDAFFPRASSEGD